MTARNQHIKTWDDTEAHYPILRVLADAEAEEGNRANVSTLVRRAIREYLERLGIFNLRDAQLRAGTIRNKRLEVLTPPAKKQLGKGGSV
jgi:Arc/MetJ-type ribon-helix-helix transcriptional regulator